MSKWMGIIALLAGSLGLGTVIFAQGWDGHELARIILFGCSAFGFVLGAVLVNATAREE